MLAERYPAEEQSWRPVEDVLWSDTINKFAEPSRDRIICTMVTATDSNISITFLKNGYVQWWDAPTLDDYDIESNMLCADKRFLVMPYDRGYLLHLSSGHEHKTIGDLDDEGDESGQDHDVVW